jgi:tRNA(adenine34) deaminase
MFNNQLMQSAILMAREALLHEEVPVGAIIINPNTNSIIASAHNLVESKKDPTAHAEILVIRQACKFLLNKNLEGLDLYVTLQPCPMCFQAIIYAKIRRLYFGAYDLTNTLTQSFANHTVEIYGGIEENTCKTLLDNFFANKRN